MAGTSAVLCGLRSSPWLRCHLRSPSSCTWPRAVMPSRRQQHTHRCETTSGLVVPSTESVGIYVHWPYCKSKCTYCDFNRYVRESVDHSRMRSCLVTELNSVLDRCQVKSVHSIFFGGGTPTLAEPETIRAIVDAVLARGLAPGGGDSIEVTMEGNPTSVEASRLEAFRAGGVNRLSLGVQALSHAGDLAVLGRNHSIDEAIKALEVAKLLFPGRYSFDLIFGRPNHIVGAWREELQRAIELAGGHVSLYQLTLEKGTPLYKQHQLGQLRMPDEETMAELFDTAVEQLRQSGYVQYEVSNFAVPGAECRHNMAYWQGLEYIGIGPGAHSRIVPASSRVRTSRIQALRPEDWMRLVEANGDGVRQETEETVNEYAGELLMLGLRTRRGVASESMARALGGDSTAGTEAMRFLSRSASCRVLFDSGYLVADDHGVKATAAGLRILDALLPRLLSALDECLDNVGLTGRPAEIGSSAGCGPGSHQENRAEHRL